MRKFSKISNYPVPERPERKVDESRGRRDELRHRILRLIDQTLSVRSYGSARPEIMIPTRIAGKELLAEALVDMLETDGKKEAAKALESMKATMGDWVVLDEKIEELGRSRDLKTERKIMGMVERWGDDADLLAQKATRQASRSGREKISEALACLDGMIPYQQDEQIRERLEAIRSAYMRAS